MLFEKQNGVKKNSIFSKFSLKKRVSKNDDNIDKYGKVNGKSTSKQERLILERNTIFDEIEQSAKQFVVGQEKYISGLSAAFQRPLLLQNGKSYANAVFVFGPHGSGRYYAIKVFTTLLYNKKLLPNADIYNLDYSNYDLDSKAESLLLQDLYKAFYGHAPIVVISNIEKGCNKAQSYISALIVDGVLKVDKRLTEKRGNLQEASGGYMLGTSDSFSVNGKYIFILSTQNKEYLNDNFSQEVRNNITDVLETSILKHDQLLEILESFWNDFQMDAYYGPQRP